MTQKQQHRTIPFFLLILLSDIASTAMGTEPHGALASQEKVTQENEWVGLVESVTVTLGRLSSIRVQEGEVDIPEPVRPLLTQLKHEVRELMLAALNDASHPWTTPNEVHNRVLSALLGVGPTGAQSLKDSTTYTYSQVPGIALDEPPGHQDLLVATTTLWVMCGSDSSLYLFRKVEGTWKLVSEEEVNDYAEVSAAQGYFQYAVSPVDADGQFFIVVMYVNPWCTSNWQRVSYRAFRVGKSPTEPQILVRRDETIYLGNDNFASIKVRVDGFRIEFDGYHDLDNGILVRRHVAVFQVKGSQASRIAPIGLEPDGFLDEWFDLRWEQSSNWVEPSSISSLRKWHQLIHSESPTRDIPFQTSFVFDPPACELSKNRWVVGIEFEPEPDQATLPADLPGQVYFTIISKEGNYLLSGASTSGGPDCASQKLKHVD